MIEPRPSSGLPDRFLFFLRLAARGDVSALAQAIEADPSLLHRRGPHGRTLLWEATRWNQKDAVAWLVEHGADINAWGRYRHETLVMLTPYCLSLAAGHHDMAAFLRESGAIEDLYTAAYLGRTEQVAHFLARSPELLYAEHPADYVYRVTPLHYAVSGGHQHTVRWLLSSGAKVAPYSTDLLHFAIHRHDLPLVELLLDHGADARQVSQFTSANALDARILERLLAAGASIHGANGSGWPLLVACRGDKGEHPEKVRLLLEHGADVHGRDDNGRTALHYAARAGFARVIAVLLEYGANIEATDTDGRTPLWAALLARRSPALLTLLQAGADPNVRQGLSQQTPLHKAVREKDVSLAALLLAYGADTQRQDAHGRMAMPDAFVDRHPELTMSPLAPGSVGEA